MILPVRATQVANPDDDLCKCELGLPIVAAIPLTTANGRHRQSTKEQTVCIACLMLEQSMREDGVTYQQAQNFVDSLMSPIDDCPPYWRKIDVQNLFPSIDWYHIRAWESNGWLTGWHRQGKVMVVPCAKVVAFLRNPQYWMAWQPETITHEGLRKWNTALRGVWPWRWMNVSEIASLLGYSSSGVCRLLAIGALRAGVQYRQAWFVRSDEVERFRRDDLPKRGNGPDPLYGGKMTHGSANMPAAYHAGICAYGGGSLSAGVRRLWEEHISHERRTAAD